MSTELDMEKFSMLIIGLGLEVTPEYGLPISISDGRCLLREYSIIVRFIYT
jgi:hypothetical protein